MEFEQRWLSDPAVFAVNRLPACSSHRFTGAAGEPFALSLDGEWKFSYSSNPESAPVGFADRGRDVSGWDNIAVPGAIQLQGDGRWGMPQYMNIMYPWDGRETLSPGEVPQDYNPVGTYVRDFLIPEEWTGPVRVRFDGADSALAVWCNGVFVGYSEDSFTPAAFDLTPYVDRHGPNRIAAQVFRFCSGSWLEDQDFWRLSGLFRSVTLYTVPTTHIADVFLRPELNDDFSCGTLYADLRIEGVLTGRIQLDAGFTCVEIPLTDDRLTISVEVPEPRLWSAEVPALYPVALRVLAPDGSVVEEVRLQAGFRRFELKDGLMCINGKRIVFKGVNRHEWNAVSARTLTREDMESDILAMKRNNINAVRTSHYPNRTEWYDLCDQYGLYVIDEMNLETHGTWQTPDGVHITEETLPGSSPLWKPSVMARAEAMFERDKNHPCILLWSCGNESSGGDILVDVHDYFRRRDTSRLVHYEGIFHNRRYSQASDIESQMYPSVEAIEDFLVRNPGKPFICCEYAHAMGNSCGALHKYTELAAREPRYQGGFLWDWIDQGLMARRPDGTMYIAHGGDFSDRPTDGNFCCNGLLFADRTESPKMQEVRACYQDFRIDASKYVVMIRNESLFRDLSEYTLLLELHRSGALCERRELHEACPPGETTSVPLPFLVPDKPGEYTVTVRILLREATAWAPAEYPVALGQCVVTREAVAPACLLPVTVTDGAFNIGVSGPDFELLFSRTAGGICSYKYRGVELMQEMPRLNFWRAPTDNDRGWGMPQEFAAWKTAGPYARLVSCGVLGNRHRADITAVYVLPTPERETVTVMYGITGDGKVETRLVWNGADGVCAPDFGLLFTLPAACDTVDYYGRGPLENYADRCTGAVLGHYSFRADENCTPYAVPQECGNRSGVRAAVIAGETGVGIAFSCPRGMDMSALAYTPDELESARHAYELPPVTKTVVRVSRGQMGVGGDDSWGARVHDEYLCKLSAGENFRFSFCGVSR